MENQSIYFASPEKLNDPLEGLRNIFWQGDQIVWRNFFKQYIYCLLRTTIHQKICGDLITRDKLELFIPVEERRDKFTKETSQSPSTNFNDLLSDIYNRIFVKNELDRLIIELGNINRKVRTDEMLHYLQIMHSVISYQIHSALVVRGIVQENQSPFNKMEPKSQVNSLVNLIQSNDDNLEKLFEAGNKILNDHILEKISTILSTSQKTTEEYQLSSKVVLLLIDFPLSFLNQLVDRLVYPRWYAACFTRECDNSSIWGHYADGHKGVCLIFEANESADGTEPTITLNQLSGFTDKGEVYSDDPMQIHDINYAANDGEIDFFRSIGWLPRPTLEEFWYCDEEGQFSECGLHLQNNNVGAWRTDYWKKFYRDISIKSKDWKYEKESRLILYSLLFELSDKERRTLTYNFNSLKGIIFGIRTSNTDKLKIIETIRKKCQKNNRRNFEFFQAHFDPATESIQKRNLHLNIFE